MTTRPQRRSSNYIQFFYHSNITDFEFFEIGLYLCSGGIRNFWNGGGEFSTPKSILYTIIQKRECWLGTVKHHLLFLSSESRPRFDHPFRAHSPGPSVVCLHEPVGEISFHLCSAAQAAGSECWEPSAPCLSTCYRSRGTAVVCGPYMFPHPAQQTVALLGPIFGIRSNIRNRSSVGKAN
jgi:hypothetical protein